MKNLNTKTLVFLSMLTALSIVFARLLSITVDPATLRISLTNVPVILASLWFGPIAGISVGFISDFIGATYLSPFGWNPLLAPTSIIVGLVPALIKRFFLKKKSLVNMLLITFVTNSFGTIAYSSFALSKMSGATFVSVLIIRAPVYVLIAALEAVLIYYLSKTGLESRLLKDMSEWDKK